VDGSRSLRKGRALASYAGIAAVARSLERLLQARFQEDEPVPAKSTKALLVRTEDLKPGANVITVPSLTLFFYRLELNRHQRPGWSAVGHLDGQGHLPLDLHLLITPWGENSEDELRILGRAMEALEGTPILSGPLLHPSGNWAPSEAIQIILDEVPAESVMRVFDLLPSDYKLSAPYLARVMRVDTRPVFPDLPAATLVTGKVPEANP